MIEHFLWVGSDGQINRVKVSNNAIKVECYLWKAISRFQIVKDKLRGCDGVRVSLDGQIELR